MEISLSSVGKRYGLEWIFRNVDFNFKSGYSYALTGHNGSGKSTLLKILSGGLSPSEGQLSFIHKGKQLTQIQMAEYVTYAAPYIHLIDDFTLQEMLEFHFRFKEMLVSKEKFMEILALEAHKDKTISNFSSGMMQRLKLSLAILTKSDILLLDEPTSYLDEHATQWYRNLLAENLDDRLVIIGSNQKHEYSFITGGVLHVPDFKYQKKLRHGTQL